MTNPNLKKINIFVCALILAVGAMALAMFNLSARHNKETRTKEKLISGLEEKLALISDARETLLFALKKSVREKREYKFSLKEEMGRARAVEEQLNRALSEMTSAKSRVRILEEENNTGARRMDILEREKGALSEQVDALKKMQTGLQEKIKRLLTKADVELGQVVVTPVDLQGRVLKANPSYNFVIIDLGKNDGIKPNSKVAIYRDAAQTGEIRIEKVYDELSVGKAAFRWTGNEISAGDIVRGRD